MVDVPVRGKPPKIRVMGSTGYSPGSFVQLMLESMESIDSVVNRPYSFPLSVSSWPDIWHFNWPEHAYASGNALISFLKCLKLRVQLDVARWRGVKIAWTVHNLAPHEVRFPCIESWFWSFFRRRVDLFVHLSIAGGELFRDRFSLRDSSRHIHLHHPAYPIPEGERADKADARVELEIDESATVFLIAGVIRPYKNVPHTISAFVELERPDSILYVVGHVLSEELKNKTMSAARGDPCVVIRFGLIEGSDLNTLIRAADIVLLPQTTFLNSGVLMLALSHSRPVIAHETPVVSEISRDVGPGWVLTYSGGLDTATLARARDWARAADADRPGPDLLGYSWTEFAAELSSKYAEISQNAAPGHQ